jgi:tetratricopeptide (TPR) repeat protein
MTDSASTPWWRRDGAVLTVLLLMAAVGFAVTFSITNSYKHREDALARRWFQAGQNDLASGKPKNAITEFRTALLYSRDNPTYRLRLAEALAASNQYEQSVAYFLNLWEEQPGNGLFNLELARLRARENRIPDAIRFYQGAIYGVWPDLPTEHRRDARIEYIQFLISHNRVPQASAEAIALASEIPSDDMAGKLQAANLLLSTGDPRRAFTLFTSLIKQEPAQAALGAGKSAFALGHFETAERYFDIAKQHGAPENEYQTLLTQSREVMEVNPDERHVATMERARRVADAYEQAGQRLQQCGAIRGQALATTTPSTTLQQLYTEWLRLDPDIKTTKLARDPDERDSVMDLVYRIEAATAQECGAPASGPDWALLMLSRFGEEVEQ